MIGSFNPLEWHEFFTKKWSVEFLRGFGRVVFVQFGRLAGAFIIFANVILTADFARAQVFDCQFLQENAPDGKANEASCTMHPDIVFNSVTDTPGRRNHCKVDRVRGLENLEGAIVDLGTHTVSWTNVYRLSDHEKKRVKAFYMAKPNFPEEIADRDANLELRNKYRFKITAAAKSGAAAKSPQEKPKHTIIFENKFWRFVLFIPEDSGESILTEFKGNAEHSWLNARFGRCKRRS